MHRGLRHAKGRTITPNYIDLSTFSGLDLTGQTDSTAAFQAAADQVPAGGGEILIPHGIITISSSITLKSRTTVRGQGAGSVINYGTQSTSFGCFLCNANPQTQAGSGDQDIVIDSLSFVAPVGPSYGFHAINFQGVLSPVMRACFFLGGGNATAMLGCQAALVEGCVARQVSNCAFDHWAGTFDARVIGNWCSVVGNVADAQGQPAGSFGIMMTGLRTDLSDSMSNGLTAVGNRIYILAGAANGSAIEFNAADDSNSSDLMCLVADNFIQLPPGSNFRGIHGAGNGGRHKWVNNILQGAGENPGNHAPALMLEGSNGYIPSNCDISNNMMIDWTVSAAQVAPISVYGASNTILMNKSVGLTTSPLINANLPPGNQVIDLTSAGSMAMQIADNVGITGGNAVLSNLQSIYSPTFGWAGAGGISAQLMANVGTDRKVAYLSGTSPRWGAGADHEAESGNNVGSNYVIERYDDNGNYLDNPFVIQRNTGFGVFNQNVLLMSMPGADPHNRGELYEVNGQVFVSGG